MSEYFNIPHILSQISKLPPTEPQFTTASLRSLLLRQSSMAKFSDRSYHLRSQQLCSIVLPILALCIIFPIAATAEREESSILLLPSSTVGERHSLCAGSTPSSCPAKCFRTDPVCGADGVTYWCGCAEAACAGAEVAKLGFCEVGNGGSANFPGQALLLVHIVWLIVLGFSVLFGLF